MGSSSQSPPKKPLASRVTWDATSVSLALDSPSVSWWSASACTAGNTSRPSICASDQSRRRSTRHLRSRRRSDYPRAQLGNSDGYSRLPDHVDQLSGCLDLHCQLTFNLFCTIAYL